MPPKDKKQEKAQQKAVDKQKLKVVEDKTFGLKNKNKSAQVQKFIKGLENQVKGGQKGGDSRKFDEETKKKEEKKKVAQQNALLAQLYKGSEKVKEAEKNSKEAAAADPEKLKEQQRIDIYTDQRVQKAAGVDEELESPLTFPWVHATLVCNDFLDAVEKELYGWMWNCPNGGDNCKYRHAIPKGYVLKRDLKKDNLLDDEDELPIEVIIEQQRSLLPSGGTKITLENFLEWKKKQAEKKESDKIKEKEEAKKAGKAVLSGRDLFSYDPNLFIDDDDADEEVYEIPDGAEVEDEELFAEGEADEDELDLDDLEEAADVEGSEQESDSDDKKMDSNEE